MFVLANAGRIAAARTALTELEQLRRTRYVSGEAMATAYAALGNRDRAFAELRRGVAERSFLLPFARTNLVFQVTAGRSTLPARRYSLWLACRELIPQLDPPLSRHKPAADSVRIVVRRHHAPVRRAAASA